LFRRYSRVYRLVPRTSAFTLERINCYLIGPYWISFSYSTAASVIELREKLSVNFLYPFFADFLYAMACEYTPPKRGGGNLLNNAYISRDSQIFANRRPCSFALAHDTKRRYTWWFSVENLNIRVVCVCVCARARAWLFREFVIDFCWRV